MKKLGLGSLVVLAILAIAATGAYAVPEMVTTGVVGPYEGTFQGMVRTERNSRAPLALDLTHRGNQVQGIVYLGEGLHVDAGWCGSVDLPALSAKVGAETVPGDARRLVANPTFDAGGFDLTVDFESVLLGDGDVIQAEARVDVPWFCGRDPVLSGTLYRN